MWFLKLQSMLFGGEHQIFESGTLAPSCNSTVSISGEINSLYHEFPRFYFIDNICEYSLGLD